MNPAFNVPVERYRSGHNEAVLKTVWGQPHMGSNPILSAIFLRERDPSSDPFFFLVLFPKKSLYTAMEKC